MSKQLENSRQLGVTLKQEIKLNLRPKPIE